MSNYDYLEFQYSDGNLPWCILVVKEWLNHDIIVAKSELQTEETITEVFLIQKYKRRQLCYQVQNPNEYSSYFDEYSREMEGKVIKK